ncbi:MAG: MarP family serine protease [Actinobacteria bacterium]|nr:MarP family serine protease [Actinomycetota bacterium]
MTALDFVLLPVLAVSGFTGYRRGALMQVLTYAGLAIGLVGGVLLAPTAASWSKDPAAQAGLAIGTILVLGGIGNAIGWAAGSHLRAKTRQTRLGTADAVGGAGLSVVAGLLVIWFLAQSLVAGPSPTLAREIRGSLVVRSLGSVLPRPPSLIGETRRLLNALGFPDVFAGLPPEPTGPVKLPGGAEIRAAVVGAQGSTVQVIGHACERIQEGSGFVVAPGYVVTNAHVVAGESVTAVQASLSRPATVVAFDPNLDIAVLHVDGLDAPPLPLDSDPVTRGTDGAVLGYPEGGPFDAEAAAVRRPLTAVGRDIYGSHVVTREVLELQTLVRPGNSGGPFVLAGGGVAGVVFAASTTDPNVGYAIAISEVQPIVQAAVGRTAAVPTGDCVR